MGNLFYFMYFNVDIISIKYVFFFNLDTFLVGIYILDFIIINNLEIASKIPKIRF